MSTMQEQISQLTRNGQWQEAIALLSEQNRLHADVQIEKQLVDLRVQGFHHTQWPAPTTVFPPAIDATLSLNTSSVIPEIAATQLDAQILNSAVQQHGSLLVRNLVPHSILSTLQHDIEQAVSTRNQRAAGEVIDSDNPYYSPSQYLNTHHKLGVGRKFIAETGGVWAADSPRGLFDVMELYRQLQLKKLLAEYFGETPCVSVKKWVLRRVDPIAGEADWHQDGAFMGKDVRSMNLWVALTDCGGDSSSPGIDIVPRRFETIVQTGTDGARFDWTVGPAYVEKNFSDTPWLRPAFKAGDALFFDHMNLHRTAWSPAITDKCHTIECWFFAASASAHNQIPMLL